MVGSVNNFFSRGDRVLVINGGKFGERWTKICQAYELQVEEIVVEWGYAVKPETVEERLKKSTATSKEYLFRLPRPQPASITI